MNHERFDSLTRALAKGRSRRQVVKATAGGALALIAFGPATRRAAAQTCGVLGDECDIANENADCCNGLVCFEAICDNPSGLCMAEGEYCGDDDLECCAGLNCISSYCEAVDLPDTGAGIVKEGTTMLRLGAAAGAIAFVAGKLIRRGP